MNKPASLQQLILQSSDCITESDVLANNTAPPPQNIKVAKSSTQAQAVIKLIFN